MGGTWTNRLSIKANSSAATFSQKEREFNKILGDRRTNESNMKKGLEHVILLLLFAGSVQYALTQNQTEEGSRDDSTAVEDAMEFLKTTLADIRDAMHTMIEVLTPSEPSPTTTTETAPTESSTTEAPAITSAPVHPCGGTGWRRVAFLNMSDPSRTCPVGWHYQPPPARGCGRVSNGRLTCDSMSFISRGLYTRVCGRVLGYQFGHTDAFRASNENSSMMLDEAYVTGVSVTYGFPRKHLWTYAAGRAERRPASQLRAYCPCDLVNTVFVPPYVGTSWYCESGDNSFYGLTDYRLFHDDVLWDGNQCASNKCCPFQAPMYFSTTLEATTSGILEARICNYDTAQFSNVIVSLLEVYVK